MTALLPLDGGCPHCDGTGWLLDGSDTCRHCDEGLQIRVIRHLASRDRRGQAQATAWIADDMGRSARDVELVLKRLRRLGVITGVRACRMGHWDTYWALSQGVPR